MKSSLLEGSARRHIIRLALPLLIGNVLQQLYNTADSLIIGKYLGTEAFSAVGIAGTIMNLFIFVLTGFCTGISILLGQMYGSGDRRAFRREVFISLTLGTGITLALSGLFLALLRPVLRLINSPEDLIPYIQSYLTVIIGGMLATYLYNLMSNMLRAIGDTFMSAVFLFLAVTCNVILDLVFVGALRTGIAGAAWATVISQVLSAMLCLLYIVKRDRELICTRADFSFDGLLVRRTLSFGFTSALHQSSLYIGKIFVQGAVNLLGTAGIAGYTATMRIEGFANSFGTSYGQAESVYLSQNYGARKYDRVRRGFYDSLIMAVILGAALSALMYVTAKPGIGIFLDASEAEATRYGVEYMHTMALFYVLCFTGNTFVGYFRGIGAMTVPVIATTMHITVRAVLSHLWVGSMGLRAVALATGAGWTLMTVFQIIMTRRLMRNRLSNLN